MKAEMHCGMQKAQALLNAVNCSLATVAPNTPHCQDDTAVPNLARTTCLTFYLQVLFEQVVVFVFSQNLTVREERDVLLA